jgi:hypothetical protein
MSCICVKKPLPPGDNPIAVNKYNLLFITYNVHTNGLAASHIHECKVMKWFNKRNKTKF